MNSVLSLNGIRLLPLCLALPLPVAHAANPSTDSGRMLPEMVVTDSKLLEEARIGGYNQPEWTGKRRFATTRVYVLPEGQVEFEQWWKGKFPRDSGKATHLFQTEVGIGLPHRLQLDFYGNVEHAPPEGDTNFIGTQVELRWAPADWGEIPLNPTLYGEWKFNNNGADAYEVKLLLGDELAPRWHWGLNAFFEQEAGGDRASELGLSQALSYTLADRKFSVGAEMKIERASAPHLHGVPDVEVLVGPSLQWLPTSNVHLDFVPLFGTTNDSPDLEAYIVLGIELGGEEQGPRAPTSTRSR